MRTSERTQPLDLSEPLSIRELEILREVAQGKSNVEIAKSLFVSISTVKFHLKNVFAKLQVKNRTEAARLFWETREDLLLSTEKGHTF